MSFILETMLSNMNDQLDHLKTLREDQRKILLDIDWIFSFVEKKHADLLVNWKYYADAVDEEDRI